MNNVLLLITLLCLVSGLFRNSLAPGRAYSWFFASGCVVLVLFSGRYAVEINKLTVEAAFSDPGVMQDLNIFVSLHFLATLGFASAKMRETFGLDRPRFFRILEYVPALSVLPAFFYLYLVSLYSFAGIPFSWIGTGLAVFAFLFMGLGSALLRMAVPQSELRTSLLLLVEFLLFLLMLCSTVFHPSSQMSVSESEPDLRSFFFMFVCVAGLFLLGYVRLGYRLRLLPKGKEKKCCGCFPVHDDREGTDGWDG